ncbi:MAG: AAA family ATPase, partial [Isosphaeraceae bacterium]
MIPRRTAWTLARALAGMDVTGELDALAETWRSMARHLAGLPKKARPAAWLAMLAARPDRDELAKAIEDQRPDQPPPEDETPRFATVADIRRLMAGIRWLWEGWIPTSRIVGIAASEGTGKTRFGLDLARRLWHGLEWPDGQRATVPVRTPTLWLCADAQQDELAETMPAFGLPDESVVFPTTPEEPYGGTDLDDPELISPGGILETAIATVKPGLVFVDTLTYATSRDLCSQDQMKIIKDSLARLVQEYRTNIVLMLHLSKEGQALGRRSKGITRMLMHLECPDPGQSHRLRLWVEKSSPFNMGNRQKHGLFEKNRGRELRKTEPDCKKPRKIGHSCML